VIPSTDNSVDAMAVKPSDVISSYSGKTIEIIDTDAEGRLVLADGLSYMVRQHHPQILIDLATLTGSSVRSLGYQAAALFSNDDQLAHHLEKAGAKTGERLWRFPLWDEYGDQMKSDVADIKNFSGLPIAGAISAAKFLEFFTDEHPSWAHLDIAGVAFGDVPYSGGKAATGYGVRLLTEFLSDLER
jgi:leucyl aminopeptidase